MVLMRRILGQGRTNERALTESVSNKIACINHHSGYYADCYAFLPGLLAQMGRTAALTQQFM